MQCWHAYSLGTVLSETIVTVSLSATPAIAHIWRLTDISYITSQMMLGISRLGYSCWRLVASYECEVLQYGICRRYYVTADRCWRLEWVGVRYHARTHVSRMQCRSAIIISTTVICRLKVSFYQAKDPEQMASRQQTAAMPSTTCK